MKITKEWFQNTELLATSTLRESKNPYDSYYYYAITINPIANKRITKKISGQKSVCKMYKNYTHDEQEEILLQLFSDISHLQDGDVMFELTKENNKHLHTTVKLKRDEFISQEMQSFDTYLKYFNELLEPIKKNYTAIDHKCLDTQADYDAWQEYIHKSST